MISDAEFPDGINYDLLHQLAMKPHPNIRDVALPASVSLGVGEVLTAAKVVHHLLDLAGVPQGTGYAADLDARMFLALRRILRQQEVLDRIVDRHARETLSGGMVGDYCDDCDRRWPCGTYLLAQAQLDENEAEGHE